MLHELEHLLHVLHTIDANTKEDIFEQGEIQSEFKEIDDFPELLHGIHNNILLLQQEEKHNTRAIWKTAFRIDWALGSCTSNIKLVRDKVGKARAYYAKRKNTKI